MVFVPFDGSEGAVYTTLRVECKMWRERCVLSPVMQAIRRTPNRTRGATIPEITGDEPVGEIGT